MLSPVSFNMMTEETRLVILFLHVLLGACYVVNGDSTSVWLGIVIM